MKYYTRLKDGQLFGINTDAIVHWSAKGHPVDRLTIVSYATGSAKFDGEAARMLSDILMIESQYRSQNDSTVIEEE